MASKGSGSATVTALFKPGKAAAKMSASVLKSRMTILKNAVKGSIKAGKGAKYPKILGVKPMKLSKETVNSQYKASMGKFIAGQMGKARQNFKKK